jgi:hypothetical protein
MKAVTLPMFFVVCLLAGCGSRQMGDEKMYAEAQTAGESDMSAAGVEEGQPSMSVDDKLANGGLPQTEKKIIKEGSMTMEVLDYPQGRSEVARIVKENGGYISRENQTDDGYRLQNDMELRLPADHFDKAIGELEKIAHKVEAKQVSAKDVTAEYVDIESRLATKKAARQKYEGFLKNAKNVSEVLEVEAQLRQITEEIEAKESELKYMQDRVSYSTLQLNIYAKLPYTHERSEYQGPSFFQRLGDGLRYGWEGFLGFVLLAFTLWPLWLGIGFGYFLFKRWRNKKNN